MAYNGENTKYNDLMHSIKERLDRTSCVWLHEVYNTWSRAKENAYNYCTGLCIELRGFNFRIISACFNNFSVAFYYHNKNDKLCIAYITRDSDRFAEIKED